MGTASVCSPNQELSGLFPGPHAGHQNTDLKLLDISPTKMGLFRTSRELQFKVCNHGEPYASPHMTREGEGFYRGKKEGGRDLVNRVHGFLLAESLPGRKKTFFLLLAQLLSQGMITPPAGLPTLFN